jgi:hypothetical protein
MLVLRHHWDLNKHGSDVVDGLEHLKTDGHVVRNHSSSLLDLLLLSLLQVLAEALTKKLLKSWVLVDLDQDLVGQLNIALSESSHTCLGDGSIVEDLVVYVLIGNHGADVGLLKQVPGFSDSVVKSMMVNLAEEGFHSHSWGGICLNTVHKLGNELLRVLN